MEDRRDNSSILIKLDQAIACSKRVEKKLDDHIEKTDKVINGSNGNPGIKTTIEVIKTRMMIVYAAISAAFIAIINDYVRRG